MSVVLAHNAYGKSQVRLAKIERRKDRHDLLEWIVDVQLEGDFVAAYEQADNSKIVATDTMKNIVYSLARDNELSAPESFGLILARHFVNSYSQVSAATISIRNEHWQRIDVKGKPHPHAFQGGSAEQRTCTVADSLKGSQIFGGIDNLAVLKTTDSAFRGFPRDAYTTLPEVDDRIFATIVTAVWSFGGTDLDWNSNHDLIRSALLETFAEHKSLSVQHTLHAMGQAALEACSDIREITLTMPNRHRLLVNLKPFGRDNPNTVFVATDEPFGLISGTLRRESVTPSTGSNNHGS